MLEALDGGVAVLGSPARRILIRLSDGRRADLHAAANAQLELQRLVLADGRTLRFVPRPTIRFA